MSSTHEYRKALVAFGQYLYDQREHINYAEDRPMTFWTKPELEAMFAKGESITMDCSWAVTELCYATGLKCPSAPEFSYADGAGNTTSIQANMPNFTDFNDAHEGTFLMFIEGPGPAHITMVMKPDGENPTLFSHGEQGDPRIVPYSEEKLNHPGQEVVLLAVDSLFPPLPPDPYHYRWFDSANIDLVDGKGSEREVVKHYDDRRRNTKKNAALLKISHTNLVGLVNRLEKIMKEDDPKGKKFHRAWRLTELKGRAAGKQYVK